MVGRLAAGGSSVVAAGAGASDLGMVEYGAFEGAGGMAVVAVVPAGDMVLSLALGGTSVMAASAGTDDREMIDSEGRPPGIGGMAILAEVRGVEMGDRFL